MQNILVTQVMKLVKERWFTIDEAVNIAFENQKARWMLSDTWLSLLWQKYSTLTSEQRAEVRYRNERGEDLIDIVKDYE